MRLKKTSVPAIMAALATVLLTGCSANKEDVAPKPTDDCAKIQAKFTADVLPLIQSKCGGCHNSTTLAGGFTLQSYADISGKASSINDAAVVNSRMPKGGPALSASEKAVIKCWISSGTPNN